MIVIVSKQGTDDFKFSPKDIVMGINVSSTSHERIDLISNSGERVGIPLLYYQPKHWKWHDKEIILQGIYNRINPLAKINKLALLHAILYK